MPTMSTNGRTWATEPIHVVDGRRAAHLRLMHPTAPHWQAQLRFRDRLHDDPGLAARYGDLKRRLAGRHRDDREAYTRAKAAFIQHSLKE